MAVLVLLLAGCSPREKRETRVEVRQAGEAVKQELKHDAQVVKQEAFKAREETRKEMKKLKERADAKDDHRRPDSDGDR